MILKNWGRSEINGYKLILHPETKLRIIPTKDHCIALIGDCFSDDGISIDDHIGSISVENGCLGRLETLEHLSGRFALVIFKGDWCAVLHDAFGARSIFYKDSGVFAFGSHAQLLAHAFGIRRRPDIASLISSEYYSNRAVKYLPGHSTLYQGIFGLVPNNYLESTGRTMHRYWPTEPRKTTWLDNFLENINDYFSAQSKFFNNSQYEPLFGITGGIDSRAIFSSFVAAGVKFRGVTWLGGYLRNTEQATVSNIVSKLKIDHIYFNPNDYLPTQIGNIAGRNTGNIRDPSRLTQGMHAHFSSFQRLIFVRGYGGEIIRGFYNLSEKRMKCLATEEMARLYLSSSKRNVIADLTSASTTMKVIRAAFENYYHSANYHKLEGLGYDPSDIFYWEHRMGMWGSTMLNEMDAAVYSLVGLNSRHLYKVAFGLPDSQRLTKDFLRAVIERQSPWLASLP